MAFSGNLVRQIFSRRKPHNKPKLQVPCPCAYKEPDRWYNHKPPQHQPQQPHQNYTGYKGTAGGGAGGAGTARGQDYPLQRDNNNPQLRMHRQFHSKDRDCSSLSGSKQHQNIFEDQALLSPNGEAFEMKVRNRDSQQCDGQLYYGSSRNNFDGQLKCGTSRNNFFANHHPCVLYRPLQSEEGTVKFHSV